MIGELSLAQTSVFGRFRITLLIPFRDKLKRFPDVDRLSADEIISPRWRVELLSDDISRIRFLSSPHREVVIYTDAATSTRIVASLVIDVEEFRCRGNFVTFGCDPPILFGNTLLF